MIREIDANPSIDDVVLINGNIFCSIDSNADWQCSVLEKESSSSPGGSPAVGNPVAVDNEVGNQIVKRLVEKLRGADSHANYHFRNIELKVVEFAKEGTSIKIDFFNAAIFRTYRSRKIFWRTIALLDVEAIQRKKEWLKETLMSLAVESIKEIGL
jgi:hypothetical protein